MNDLVPIADGDAGAMQAMAVRAVAETLSSCVEYASDRQKWIARLQALDAAFQKHDRTEENMLDLRRMETEISRAVILTLIEKGEADKAVEAFNKYMDGSPDILGRAVELILGSKQFMS